MKETRIEMRAENMAESWYPPKSCSSSMKLPYFIAYALHSLCEHSYFCYLHSPHPSTALKGSAPDRARPYPIFSISMTQSK
jgi:hypothetical protein